MSSNTRRELIAAAEELFAAEGYAAVGIREIAARAGANVSAIKYHFGSKRDLYLEAVRSALEDPEIQETWAPLRTPPRSRPEAGRVFVGFVRDWLGRLLVSGETKRCTHLMLREAMRPSEAIDSVVRDFVVPHEELLVGALRVLAPRLGERELLATARSVLGQLLHYMVFRPFIEGRPPGALLDAAEVAQIANHVASFSLRGLSCSESFIAKALAPESSSEKRQVSS